MLEFIGRRKPSMAQIAKYTRFHHPHVLEVIRQFEREKLIRPLEESRVPGKQKGAPYQIEFTLKGKVVNRLMQMFHQVSKDMYILEIAKKLKIKTIKEEISKNPEKGNDEDIEFMKDNYIDY